MRYRCHNIWCVNSQWFLETVPLTNLAGKGELKSAIFPRYGTILCGYEKKIDFQDH
jgi:hypothetical protein